MPAWWIIALILFVSAIPAVLAALMYRHRVATNVGTTSEDRRRRDDASGSCGFSIFVAVTLVGLGLLCTLISSFNVVSTRNVGIVTSFGRPVGERSAGLAWVWPWQRVHEMDAAIQLQSFQGNSYDDPQSAIKVRLGNNSAAFVEENLNWRIRPEAAGSLFQDYRTFENLTINLVDKQAQVALSKEFATFNPQLVTAGTVTPAQNQGADLPAMAERVKRDLQAAVGDRIEIMDVRIPGIFYDSATQQRIDQYNQKVQETRNAEQDVATAHQRKLAAEEVASQAVPNLDIAKFNCINKAAADGRDSAGCFGQIGGTPLIQVPR